ncbi:ABC transporter related protein [Coriobacterium glomerans PW2]|uniref:ABC transporter related protein n=1 Tax=Coriobacterium glomerans (strain ATCC 49209 / DSM 20642 / JCM 10262 / PW2) TaxID=700015 RepID=F2N750_CORGP|nr:ABC transporter ATP-binding protein [Coriobacterium glomerans]AEB06389.1 ABC transporter related protein [Coriobacterium glomerans PW2]
MAVLEARGLEKSFEAGGRALPVIRGVDLAIAQGEFVSIVGKSGSGKSTLLYLLSGLERPSAGEVVLDGEVISDRSDNELTRLRRERFGFVFQSYNLIPNLSAFENIALPLYLNRVPTTEVKERIEAAVEALGVGDLLAKGIFQLSGGEQQRISIARAIVAEPDVLFADEPTGNLDSATGREVFDTLRSINAERGMPVVMVTHDEDLARAADRRLEMSDGRLGQHGGMQANH